jgi:hypothetical protein
MNVDPYYQICCLKGYHSHVCGGRLTREHALIYAGRQIQEYYAIIPVCAAGQEVDTFQDAGTMNKELNVWIALNRATDDELRGISKVIDYIRERNRLNEKYGVYFATKIMAAVHTKGHGGYKLNWICTFCDTINLNIRHDCIECGAMRHLSEEPTSSSEINY